MNATRKTDQVVTPPDAANDDPNPERIRKTISPAPWHSAGLTANEKFVKIVNNSGDVVCLIPIENTNADRDAAIIAAAPDLQKADAGVLRWIEGKGSHKMPRSVERQVIYAAHRTRARP